MKNLKLASRETKTQTIVHVNGLDVGRKLVVIAGPCGVESEAQTLETARAVKAAGADMLRGGAFKPRTSPYSFQGLGLQGLQILERAKKETGLAIVTEVAYLRLGALNLNASRFFLGIEHGDRDRELFGHERPIYVAQQQ